MTDFSVRFLVEQEDGGWTFYIEMEPLLEYAKEFMDADAFLRFELGARRAAASVTPRRK